MVAVATPAIHSESESRLLCTQAVQVVFLNATTCNHQDSDTQHSNGYILYGTGCIQGTYSLYDKPRECTEVHLGPMTCWRHNGANPPMNYTCLPQDLKAN